MITAAPGVREGGAGDFDVEGSAVRAKPGPAAPAGTHRAQGGDAGDFTLKGRVSLPTQRGSN